MNDTERLRELARDGWLGAQADKVRDDLYATADALDEWRALADDLAAKLDRTLIVLRARSGFYNLVADGDDALARYREARRR